MRMRIWYLALLRRDAAAFALAVWRRIFGNIQLPRLPYYVEATSVTPLQ